AISFILLIGAGLMLRSLFKMLQVNPGFVPDRVLAMQINFNWSKYGTSEQFAQGAKKLVDRIQAEPGVLSAAVSSTYPLEHEVLTGGPNTVGFQIEGHPLGPGEAPPLADVVMTSPDFFRTLGIPLLRGREFRGTDDAKALQVVIINQTFQRRFFPNDDPVGKRLTTDNGKSWNTIVGVVGDVRDLGLDHAPTIQAYAPLAQNPHPGTLLIRTAADPMSMANQMNRAVHEVDSQTAVSNVQTLAEARADSVASPQVTASLLAIFAGLALLIAAAGIGGIMALTVSQRVREIGIRMALGAQPSKILGMILGQGLMLSALGVGIGAAGAYLLTGLVKSLLFQVEPTDPITFGAVALVLIAAALMASFLPARRAAAIDPMIALRSE
ncbi:MAG: FtsX-like permease family protein, partial [Candidatus Acidiferrales bacterium]